MQRQYQQFTSKVVSGGWGMRNEGYGFMVYGLDGRWKVTLLFPPKIASINSSRHLRHVEEHLFGMAGSGKTRYTATRRLDAPLDDVDDRCCRLVHAICDDPFTFMITPPPDAS